MNDGLLMYFLGTLIFIKYRFTRRDGQVEINAQVMHCLQCFKSIYNYSNLQSRYYIIGQPLLQGHRNRWYSLPLDCPLSTSKIVL